jgi:hypothetical protein
VVALRPGSTEFEAAFGASIDAYDDFRSEFPTYQEIQNSWLDPSVGASWGLDRFETTAAKQARDLAKGARLILFDLATDFGTQITKFNNYPPSSWADSSPSSTPRRSAQR